MNSIIRSMLVMAFFFHFSSNGLSIALPSCPSTDRGNSGVDKLVYTWIVRPAAQNGTNDYVIAPSSGVLKEVVMTDPSGGTLITRCMSQPNTKIACTKMGQECKRTPNTNQCCSHDEKGMRFTEGRGSFCISGRVQCQTPPRN